MQGLEVSGAVKRQTVNVTTQINWSVKQTGENELTFAFYSVFTLLYKEFL